MKHKQEKGEVMKFVAIILALVFGLAGSSVLSADDNANQIRAAIESLTGSALLDDAITQSATPGIYVVYINAAVYHATLIDGVLLVGEAFDLEKGISLNDEITNRALQEAVSSISPSDMVIFAASEPKRYVTVFTDIDCGYCRRFHQEITTLTAAGLEVRYVAFPRSGVGTASYDKIVTVWCSDDPQTAMTQAKGGVALAPLSCENPVAEQYYSGVDGGVQGTPTLVLDDGTVIGGYLPAEQLLARIGLIKS